MSPGMALGGLRSSATSRPLGSLLGDWLSSAEALFERFLGRSWLLKATFLAVGLSLLHGFPAYENVNNVAGHANWQGVLTQARHPFAAHDYAAASHASKLAYRLTPALIGHLLRLRVAGFMVMHAVFGVVLLALVIHLAAEITGDRVIGALTGVAVGLAWAGSTGFDATNATFDAVGLTFLVAASSARQPLLIAPLTTIACFSEERAIIGSLLVFVVQRQRSLRWAGPQTLAVVLGVVAYGLLRLLISHLTGLPTSSGGISLSNITHEYVALPLGAWSAFEALWLLVLIAAIQMMRSGQWAELALSAVGIGALLLGAIALVDISRTIIYALPAAFIALLALRDEERVWLRQMMLVVCAVSFLALDYYVDWPATRMNASLVQPLPIQLVVSIRDGF